MPDPEDLTREQILEQFLKPGDTITHTRCMGCVEEHVYIEGEGPWLCGRATPDTIRIEGWDLADDHYTDDISPANVTHINRTPLDAVPFLAKLEPAKGESS